MTHSSAGALGGERSEARRTPDTTTHRRPRDCDGDARVQVKTLKRDAKKQQRKLDDALALIAQLQNALDMRKVRRTRRDAVVVGTRTRRDACALVATRVRCATCVSSHVLSPKGGAPKGRGTQRRAPRLFASDRTITAPAVVRMLECA